VTDSSKLADERLQYASLSAGWIQTAAANPRVVVLKYAFSEWDLLVLQPKHVIATPVKLALAFH
jgi:hypothetical protein